MSIFSRIFGLKPIQYTRCFCPGCSLDLVSRVEVDGTSVTDTDLVRYICGNCKTYSEWDFDLAPAPILLRAEQHRSWMPIEDKEDGLLKLHTYDRLLGHWSWKPKKDGR